jgi:hypothetical protein
MSTKIFKTKTFWGSVAALIGAAAGAATGEIDVITAIQTGGQAVLFIFLRDGMFKRPEGF